MKNLSIVFAILMVANLFSCESENHGKVDLFGDKDLCQIFNAKEIESLASMVDFVDSAVVAITNNKNEADAYHDFFEASGKSLNETSKKINPLDEKEKYDFLESMDKGAFDAIWRFDTHIDRLKYKDTNLTNVDYITYLNINPFGRYMKYLAQVGKKDQRYKDLHDTILPMGDLSASTGLWTIHHEFDFGKVENRIFAAIYILRIEDSLETKLDRFFRGKNSTHNRVDCR